MISKPISTESLQKLQVAVKGGGIIVSHPPTFSPDSKTLYIIQNNAVLFYDTSSGRCVSKFNTPSATPIANVVSYQNKLLVLTTAALLYEVQPDSLSILSTKEVMIFAKNYPSIANILDFIWPGDDNAQTFLFLGYSQDGLLPSLYAAKWSDKPKLHAHYLCDNIVVGQHSVGCGAGGRLVAGIQESRLFVKELTGSMECGWHKAGSRKFTCVAVHPNDMVVATGDDSGRILIWANILRGGGNYPVAKSIYHWHTLPVADLCFSANGSQLYSGGGECTLIKWDLNNTGNKRTLPRMGLPIRHVRAAIRDDMVAVSHADNSIQLVNAYNEIFIQIQNMTQCYIPQGLDDVNISDCSLGGTKVFQAGLHFDPNNSSLVTNGKPGHLQCYSFREDSHLYNLDITQQNFITAERNNPIPNSDVSHVAFSKNGSWLATGETRVVSGKTTELRLKFWKFDRERQKFILNTSIEWPHEQGIIALKIQPISDSDPTLMAATAGTDAVFKTWGIVHDSSIHGKSEWWNCEYIGSYRGLNCGPLSFSQDGSLLCVAFEKVVTVWNTDNNELKLTLSHSQLPENVTLLEFGSHQSSHLIIACSNQNIAVWDVLTCSLLWVANFQADSLAVDPLSNLAVAVSNKQQLIFFSPDQPEPLAVHKSVSSSRVLASVFVPHENVRLQSTVFFINATQELCALLPPTEEVKETIRISSETEKSILTPFAQLLAEKTVHEYKKPIMSTGQVNLEGFKILRDIMDQSPHTMPSLTYYCSRLLKSFSQKRSAGDSLAEMEVAVAASFTKNKTKSMELDETAEFGDELQNQFSKMLHIQKKEPHSEENDIKINLDLVADDNSAWIDNIFENET